jgi:hypothetical protein
MTIGAAVMIGRIATGEIEDLTTDDGKNDAAVARWGVRMGGKARAEGMSARTRSEMREWLQKNDGRLPDEISN